MPQGSSSQRISLFAASSGSIRLSVGVGLVRALLGAAAALLVGAIVRALSQETATASLIAGLVLVIVVRALLAAITPIAAARTAGRVERDLRRRVLQAVLVVGPREGHRTGDLVGKATEGIGAIGALGATFLPQLIGGMVIPLALIVVVAVVDWPTALVLLVVIPLVPVMLRLLERRFASVSTRYRETADELAARFLDGVQGLRTLKALDRATEYGDSLAAESERLRAETMRLLRVNQLALLAVDSLFTLGTVVAAAAMAGARLAAGAIDVADAATLVILGVMLIEPLTAIGRFFYVGAIGRAAATQVRELLGLTEGTPRPHREGDRVERGVVEFEGVRFTYPDGTRAVDGVSFSVAPGERVALVGPSGAGKTTVANLVLGLLDPDEGAVEVGGRAVLVAQRPFLFHGTLADNLRLARPGATEEEMWAALTAAGLEELVTARDEGLEIPVGERGLRLSGGEVQRVAIARALLVDAEVVVLDEPTSSVDLATEARIRDALDRLMAGRTVIVIAHRRSTIEGVDRVIGLDHGRLVAVQGQGPGTRS